MTEKTTKKARTVAERLVVAQQNLNSIATKAFGEGRHDLAKELVRYAEGMPGVATVQANPTGTDTD